MRFIEYILYNISLPFKGRAGVRSYLQSENNIIPE
jgi:hypothetical protein